MGSPFATGASYGVTGSTAATGAATYFQWIPSDIGNLASLIGIAGSVVVAWYWIRKSIREERESNAELRLKQAQIDEANSRRSLAEAEIAKLKSMQLDHPV